MNGTLVGGGGKFTDGCEGMIEGAGTNGLVVTPGGGVTGGGVAGGVTVGGAPGGGAAGVTGVIGVVGVAGLAGVVVPL
ncbi:MAG: hypothetical protein AB1813_02580 [Verrucomicrobiota bacterium]